MLGLDSISKSNPILAYFFVGQVVLFCTALLVGAVLLLKRISKKQPFEGDPQFDNGRIAQEVHSEILKLQDLRNRLDPSFASLDPALSATAGGAPSAVDRAVVEREVSAKFEKTISDLQKELSEAKTVAANSATAAPAAAAASVIPEGYLSPEQVKIEIAKVTASSGEIKKKLDSTQAQVVHLEKVLSEYRVFEEDFALVKKYKTENETLKRQIEASGGGKAQESAPQSPAPSQVASAPATATQAAPAAEAPAAGDPNLSLTQDEISKMFSGPGAEPAVVAAPASSPEVVVSSKESLELAGSSALPKDVKTSEGVPLGTANSPSDQDLNSLFADMKNKEGEAEAPAPAADLAPAAPSPALSAAEQTLAKALDEKGSEAAAEAGGTPDNLMAEFEKLLSGEQKS